MSFRSSGGPQPYSSTNLGSRPSGTTPGLNPPPPVPTSKPGSGAGSDGPGTNPPSVNPSKRDLFFNNSSSPATSLIQSINKNSTPMEPHKHGMVSNGNGAANGHGHEKFDKDKEKTQQKPSNKKTLDGYVGFANLPNQIYRKAVKRGFDFCVMVVGSSGLGKSTLINSMFLTDIYSSEEYPGPSVRSNKKTVKVESTQVLLKEKGVNLTLRIVDTPGFGDDVDNSNCWSPIVSSIESRYEDYLNAESRVNRQQRIPDSRVHVCLYFIPPTGHGLRAIDLEFMKRLHDKVNLVPIIGKADTLTGEEMAAFKKQILNELTQQKIKVYNFPDCDDEEENKVNKELRSRVPFAVVGSNTLIEIDGKKVRGRKYPWGTVQVENLEHNDFLALRNMILRTHLQDLKDVTNNVHYENYRCRKLAGIGPDGKELGGGSGEGSKAGGRAVLNGNSNLGSGNEKNPLAQMEEEKKSHYMKMKKMESEMEQVFEMKVKERNQRLADSEQDLKKRSEQMSKQLEKMRMDIDDKKRQFELERSQWEKENGITLEDLKRLKDGKEYTDGSGKKPKKKGLF